MTQVEQPHAARVAAALEAARIGDDPTPGLVDAAAVGEEVVVPLSGDGPSPMGMTDDDGPALVAFTDMARLVWAFPDGPQVALVPFGSILAATVGATRPLRLDPTTSFEVRIETSAAAALVEGRTPDAGIVHTGSRFEAPDTSIGRSEAVVAGDEPPPHGAVRYADGVDPLSVDEARERHDAGEPYVAVVDHGGHDITVRVSADGAVSERHDDAGRPTVIAGFRSMDGLLLHDYLETRDYVEGLDEPAAQTVVRYQPDGTMRVSIGGGGAMDTVDSSDVELSWVPPIAFGDYRWVLDPR